MPPSSRSRWNEEAVFVRYDVERRTVAVDGARLHSGGQHHEIIGLGVDLAFDRSFAMKDRTAVFADPDVRRLRLDERHLRVRPNPIVERLELIVGADINVIDVYFRVGVLLAQIGRMLERSETADARAIGQMVEIARSGALDQRDLFRRLAVRRTQDLAVRRAVMGREPLHLDIGDDVAAQAVAVAVEIVLDRTASTRWPRSRLQHEGRRFRPCRRGQAPRRRRPP